MNDATGAKLKVRLWKHVVEWTEPPKVFVVGLDAETGEVFEQRELGIAEALASSELTPLLADRLRPYLED